MSAISSLAGSTSASSGSAKSDGFSSLSSEEFMRIIFAELSNQDPLKPNDSNQLVQQMANIRSIQSDIELSKKLETLVTENQLASAGNLIGTYISGLTEQNQRTEGLVVSISRTPGGPILNLQSGLRIPLNRVDEVVDPTLASALAGGPGRPLNQP
ncbi:MAG: hypothetical protein JNK35_03100 [Phycisphaerae bacterium]|nr:hypothetical protein [Phycisphaerae bacterium]